MLDTPKNVSGAQTSKSRGLRFQASWVQLSNCPESKRLESKCPEPKRPVSKHPGVQSLSIQCPGVQIPAFPVYPFNKLFFLAMVTSELLKYINEQLGVFLM